MWKLSPKIFFLTLSFVLLANQSLVRGAKLRCNYYSGGYFTDIDKSVYYCYVVDTSIFTAAERVRIDSVDGVHEANHTNANVIGIHSTIYSTKFFPQNLENIFVNLLAIQMYGTSLEKIKQEDIKPFTKLQYLHLGQNKITMVDEVLFKFNPDLRYINLHSNQIYHIDQNVFNHLSHLSILKLSGNQCKNSLSNAESRSEVEQLIQRVRNGDCYLNKQKIINQLQAANEEMSTKYKSVIDEKSKQVTILQQKLREAEKINQEKAKINEKSNAELNKNLSELREQNEKLQAENKESKMDFDKIQSANQELMTTVENLTLNLTELQQKYENNSKENEQSSSSKITSLRDKYESLLQSKLVLSESLNGKLHELNEKYSNLLNTKLIESEKTVAMQNENIRNINKVKSADDEQMTSKSCMILWFENQQTPIVLVN